MRPKRRRVAPPRLPPADPAPAVWVEGDGGWTVVRHLRAAEGSPTPALVELRGPDGTVVPFLPQEAAMTRLADGLPPLARFFAGGLIEAILQASMPRERRRRRQVGNALAAAGEAATEALKKAATGTAE